MDSLSECERREASYDVSNHVDLGAELEKEKYRRFWFHDQMFVYASILGLAATALHFQYKWMCILTFFTVFIIMIPACCRVISKLCHKQWNQAIKASFYVLILYITAFALSGVIVNLI